MATLIQRYFKGDKPLWSFILVLAIFSFLPVYSASSNLVYTVGTGTVFSHLMKHAGFLFVGILIIYFIQKLDYRYFGIFALTGVVVLAVLLVFTLVQGESIGGANASRWIMLPGIGVGIQPSTIASQALLIYIARFLTKNRDKEYDVNVVIVQLMLPMLITIGLIFPSNGSTALMLALMCGALLFIGGFPIKYLSIIGAIGLALGGTFIWAALTFSDKMGNTRVHTWVSRIEKFFSDESQTTLESYQVLHAKAAIARGITEMAGPGKSVFKQTLPQSSSDFIFAIIVEEYGAVGAILLVATFLIILFRICVIASKIHTVFGTLLVFAVGIPIIFQAMINMAVAVNLIPVTGQPLPMISYGGTAMWMTCVSFGIILSVSTQIKTPEELEIERKRYSGNDIEDIA
ncbi:FtsW/RodA/SpoVE family cell cycle protein [Faecalibacter rhinopitheci]|uniref:Probable peptidoglycan glycosyltransferase FtsW n=1 Tax=Faecalibacter rhinopitheci TaxID=2779678 RepID=A0A8J7FLS2_9FLAO|nr:FtsW/RodA/SpoVE family cell cycle protein [Faecalibacter rhinopitheci]MBF0596692.1 FtsW/RodA/SpoVE family cell cycle protein [Faecalibacter rhinopitheci]